MNEKSKQTPGINKADMYDELSRLRCAIFDGQAQRAKELTEEALQLGYSTKTILERALFPPMMELDKQLQKGDIFIPNVLMSTRAMQGALYALQPLMSNHGLSYQGTVVIGTVAGDLHDIGKDLVAMVLRGRGFSVIDLGIDVTAEAFIEAIKCHKPDILAMSAMLTTTLPEMKTIIDAIVEEGLRPQITIMIGGVPATKEYAREIKADIYTDTLFDAGDAAEKLMEHRISRHSV